MRRLNNDYSECDVYVIFDGEKVWRFGENLYKFVAGVDEQTVKALNVDQGDDFAILVEGGAWILCKREVPADGKYFKALSNHNFFFQKTENAEDLNEDVSYFAIGPSFNGNKHGMISDVLLYDRCQKVNDLTDRTATGIKRWMKKHPNVYGLMFVNGENTEGTICRADVDLKWPNV